MFKYEIRMTHIIMLSSNEKLVELRSDGILSTDCAGQLNVRRVHRCLFYTQTK